MRFRHKTYEENLEDIRKRHGPPAVWENSCDICGETATDTVVHTFVPSRLTGTRTTKHFCKEHGRQFHNLVKNLFGYNEVAA